MISSESNFGPAVLGQIYIVEHPLLEDVETFEGSISTGKANVSLAPTATRVADWDTGEALIAYHGVGDSWVIGLNMLAESTFTALANGWLGSTDGGLILANALLFESSRVAVERSADTEVPRNSFDRLGAVSSSGSSFTYTVVNRGNAELELASDAVSVRYLSNCTVEVLAQPDETTLAVGSSTSFEIEVTPEDSGEFAAVLSIASNEASGSLQFTIIGHEEVDDNGGCGVLTRRGDTSLSTGLLALLFALTLLGALRMRRGR